MNDEKNSPERVAKTREPDTRFIDLDSRGELEFWLKVFNTSKDELLAAISEVGPYAGAVAIHLNSLGPRAERGE